MRLIHPIHTPIIRLMSSYVPRLLLALFSLCAWSVSHASNYKTPVVTLTPDSSMTEHANQPLLLNVAAQHAHQAMRIELAFKYDPKALAVTDKQGRNDRISIRLPSSSSLTVVNNIVDVEHHRIRILLEQPKKASGHLGLTSSTTEPPEANIAENNVIYGAPLPIAQIALTGKQNKRTHIQLVRGKFRDQLGGDLIAAPAGVLLQANESGTIAFLTTDEARRKRAMPWILGAVLILMVIGALWRKFSKPQEGNFNLWI